MSTKYAGKRPRRESEFSQNIEKVSDIDDNLEKLCQFTGGKYAVYHLVHKGGACLGAPYVRTNYPAGWVRRYVVKNYIEIDPVVRRGFTSALPFFWDEVEIRNETEVEFFQDAKAHSIGGSGFSIPVSDKANRRALLSVSSNRDHNDLRKRLDKFIPLLIECANIIHHRVVSEEIDSDNTRPALSPREIECLAWIAKGKDCSTISVILGLSEHTVRDYLKSARFKMGCTTLAHAVHKATVAGFLDFPETQSP